MSPDTAEELAPEAEKGGCRGRHRALDTPPILVSGAQNAKVSGILSEGQLCVWSASGVGLTPYPV